MLALPQSASIQFSSSPSSSSSSRAPEGHRDTDCLIEVLALADWKKGPRHWAGKKSGPELQAWFDRVVEEDRDPPSAGAVIRVPSVMGPIAGWSGQDRFVALLPEPQPGPGSEKSLAMFHALEFARDTLKTALAARHRRLILAVGKNAEPATEAFGAALAVRLHPMPVFGKRAKKTKPFLLKEVVLAGDGKKAALERLQYGYATGEGSNLARWLATLPPNELGSTQYGEFIRKLARQHGLGYRFYSNRELRKMGAGAFTAVDRGDPESQGGIHELVYAPKKGSSRAPIALVGKGLCFDSGGYDIKVGGGMITMKGDMQGSAVALGTIVTAASLGLATPVHAYLAVTENRLSAHAYTPDEVVTALNGLTIEVVNTDAEGRMVLADALTLASRGLSGKGKGKATRPACVIDFATLTGMAVMSIGTKYSAGFTNREKWHDAIRESGARSGERIWTFPLDSTYFKALDSKIADTLQCLKGRGPDHIYAACFLSKFVEEGVPWVHVDLSASENEGGIGHVDSLFTGFGVRWALDFMKTAVH